MHLALKVPEVLRLIFECNLDKHLLFNCSLVCRLWAIWASETLWTTGHVPLLAVLQPFALITETGERESEEKPPYVEIGSINEHSWCRFLVLANRPTGITVDGGIWEASLERIKLAKQRFGGEPFSKLRSLKTRLDYEWYGANSLVTVPTLASVTVSGDYPSHDGLTWVADRIPALAPQITHFCVALDSHHWLDLSRYSSLKALEMHDCDVKPRFWESLSGCQYLRKVVLTSCVYWDWFGAMDWRGDLVHFPALRLLKTCRTSSFALFKLVLHSSMPMLEGIWWDADEAELGEHQIGRVAGHLKQCSPKVDTDMLSSPKLDVSNSHCYIGSSDCDDSDSNYDNW